MTATLKLEPEREAAEVREVLGDVRSLLKLRMRRPDTTAARIIAIGKVLHVVDDLEEGTRQPVLQLEEVKQ